MSLLGLSTLWLRSSFLSYSSRTNLPSGTETAFKRLPLGPVTHGRQQDVVPSSILLGQLFYFLLVFLECFYFPRYLNISNVFSAKSFYGQIFVRGEKLKGLIMLDMGFKGWNSGIRGL